MNKKNMESISRLHTATYQALERYVANSEGDAGSPCPKLEFSDGEVRYQVICDSLGLSEVAEMALRLAIIKVWDSESFSHVTAPLGASVIVTLELAEAMVSEGGSMDMRVARMAQAFQSLEPLLLTERGGTSFFRRPLEMDGHMLDWLMGLNEIDPVLGSAAELFLPAEEELRPIYAAQESLLHVIDALDADDDENAEQVIQIAGETGAGRRFLLMHGAKYLEIPFVLLYFNRLAKLKPEELELPLERILREAILYNADICIYGIETDADAAVFCPIATRLLANRPGLLIFITGRQVAVSAHISELVGRIDLPKNDMKRRIALWEGFASEYKLHTALDRETIAVLYRLLPAEIDKVAARLSQMERKGIYIDDQVFAQITYEVAPLTTGNLRKIASNYRMEDIILPSEQKEALRHVCDVVRYRRTVYDTWGLGKRYSYGNGVTVLFTGSPGTGKTMAAHVLSNELKLELYRVDLSQVIDKYIGESEKKLEEIFTKAEKNNVVLFFDEADAVFGQRSEVNDARDRYANTEVSYLLQRIEEYDGIVIMATNFRKNIDSAFIRRVRYVIDFPLPDVPIRRQIWKGCVTSETETEELDFDFLAERFELTGAEIKNIMLDAAFRAAACKEAIAMSHVVKSIQEDYKKNGRMITLKEFGIYSNM